jgi:hypothetical protein
MMSRAAFRQYRDAHALELYRARYPVLARRANDLRNAIAELEATEKPKVIEDEKHNREGLYYALQDVTSEMDTMVRDAENRKGN